jgi:ABC-2 type transport system ATP-binding protein
LENAIETRGLSRRFGRLTAVDNVSLSVPQGAVYGFLGRNGAGKTTTLKMLLGLIRPTAGQALIDGVDIARDRLAAARRTGALLEAHGFYGNLSGEENLDLTRRLLDLDRAEIGRVLSIVEMSDHASRRVSDYSLGMRQRLGIARALLGAPPVLILDEPTNGLDPDGMAEMRTFLRALPDRTGATVLLSSHLLGEVEQTATHIGILSEGRLVLQGELARLRADLAPEIVLEADDPARAADLARSAAASVERTETGAIVTLPPGADARAASAELNRALVRAGVAVSSIGPRARSLEGIYRQVVAPARKEAA